MHRFAAPLLSICLALTAASGPLPSLAASHLVPQLPAQAPPLRFTAPDGGLLVVDASLVPALTTLSGLDIGAPLVNALARGGVRLELADLAEWGTYATGERVIRIDSTLRGADSRALAALLAREASQAQNDLAGLAARDEQVPGQRQACVTAEPRATEVELQVWMRLFGPYGKVPALNGYEELVNEQFTHYLDSPEAFRASAAREHSASCFN